MLKEFREFAVKGNVIDLAVALVVGNAFGAVAFRYGLFVNSIISFLIVSFAMFLVVRLIMRLKHAEPPSAVAASPEVKEEVLLLREIRDALASKP